MNGKGDSPRNCFSDQFRNNFETINWGKRERKRKKLTTNTSSRRDVTTNEEQRRISDEYGRGYINQ